MASRLYDQSHCLLLQGMQWHQKSLQLHPLSERMLHLLSGIRIPFKCYKNTHKKIYKMYLMSSYLNPVSKFYETLPLMCVLRCCGFHVAKLTWKYLDLNTHFLQDLYVPSRAPYKIITKQKS